MDINTVLYGWVLFCSCPRVMKGEQGCAHLLSSQIKIVAVLIALVCRDLVANADCDALCMALVFR